jgi:CRP-like cAMP-binding protein
VCAALAQAGSYFGEIALLCQVHRTMTVRAGTMGLVFVVMREHFDKLMKEYPVRARDV